MVAAQKWLVLTRAVSRALPKMVFSGHAHFSFLANGTIKDSDPFLAVLRR